jgi:hypothetical protein
MKSVAGGCWDKESGPQPKLDDSKHLLHGLHRLRKRLFFRRSELWLRPRVLALNGLSVPEGKLSLLSLHFSASYCSRAMTLANPEGIDLMVSFGVGLSSGLGAAE